MHKVPKERGVVLIRPITKGTDIVADESWIVRATSSANPNQSRDRPKNIWSVRDPLHNTLYSLCWCAIAKANSVEIDRAVHLASISEK